MMNKTEIHKLEYWNAEVAERERNGQIINELRSTFADFIETCREKIELMETGEAIDKNMMLVATLLNEENEHS